ncbi:MAG TPA: glycosyltransferase [Solirubrobacteraceae bacterium]|jgi:glycosyltransferase involved in cell wall biosynthesis|nr:glycosyltransferase [Solirubrobacteraceae bacterium]
MRVAVLAEFYPRAADPVLGVWAHRQALAVREAGADVRVIVLHRVIPPRSSASAGPRALARAMGTLLTQPRHEVRDGLEISYVPFVSPSRGRSYASWGAWAAPLARRALTRLRRSFAFDLIHAHNAVPAGDAALRAGTGVPVVVSVHGGDVLYTAPRLPGGDAVVRRTLAGARLVLANSSGIERLARAHGACDLAVVHLGADPVAALPASGPPTLITVGHLVARKRHADVIRALARIADRQPELGYVIVGDGPERGALAALAHELGVGDRVSLPGQLEPAAALRELRRATVFAMPSTEEAFGVAYVEAMAAGVPAIGCLGEPGPEEIRAVGPGLRLVEPGDIAGLATAIEELLEDRRRFSQAARATVESAFTWRHCGEQTLAAYERALR